MTRLAILSVSATGTTAQLAAAIAEWAAGSADILSHRRAIWGGALPRLPPNARHDGDRR